MALSTDFGNIIFIGGFFKPMFLHGGKYVAFFVWEAKDMREEGLLCLTS